MTWWAWALLAWLALSVPVAVILGRAIAHAQSEDEDEERSDPLFGETDSPPRRPPRDEDKSA